MQNTNGGSLLGLGGDDSMLKVATQGSVSYSHTDEDGETESSRIDFGSGSLLESQND